MFKLQKINVVRIVEDEYAKAKLISQGFIEIIEKEVVGKVVKIKEEKGKE